MSSTLEQPPPGGSRNPPPPRPFDDRRLINELPPMRLRSVHDLRRMNDAGLLIYMRQFCGFYGDLVITESNSDGLSMHQLARLQERIRQIQPKVELPCSSHYHTVNFQYLKLLDERLCKIPADITIPKPFTEPPTPEPQTPTQWEFDASSWDDELVEHKQWAWQMDNYTRLVNDGGRPAIGLDLLDDLNRNPIKYEVMAASWRAVITSPKRITKDIFEMQLIGWEFFRRWQRYNRGLGDTGTFEDFAIHSWRKRKILESEAACNEFLQDIRSSSPSMFKEEWEAEQRFRVDLQKYFREECESFEGYGAAVEKRLARHGVSRSFKPDIDPGKQDALTTWIEYLAHMCWWLDVNKERRDWLALGSEYVKAYKEHEKSLKIDQEDPERETKIQAAQKLLDRLTEDLLPFQGDWSPREPVVSKTPILEYMQEIVDRTEKLVHWTLEQVLLVETETKNRNNQQNESAGAEPIAVEAAGEDGASSVPIQDQAQHMEPQAETFPTVLEPEENGIDRTAESRQVDNTDPAPPSNLRDNALNEGLKRRGSISEQAERRAKVRKVSNNNGAQSTHPQRRSKRVEENARKASAEKEAKKAKEEEAARLATAKRERRKVRDLKLNRPTPPTRQSERVAKIQKAKAEMEARKSREAEATKKAKANGEARKFRAEEAAKKTKATKEAKNAKNIKFTQQTQPARRSERVAAIRKMKIEEEARQARKEEETGKSRAEEQTTKARFVQSATAQRSNNEGRSNNKTRKASQHLLGSSRVNKRH